MRPKAGVKRDISRLYFVFQATNNILMGGNGMNSKRIQLLLTGVAAWISLLLMITTTYGASIVIGGDYTDMGTIVIVSPKPGDTPLNNGTALLNNLADITADANNPYLIKLGPGIYDIGTSSLQMKSYVDVEGSGENTTVITGHIDGDMKGVVQGANNAEIRFLTVRNTGGGIISAAIYNTSASPKITNVTASGSGGSNNSIGVYNNSSSPTMTNVTTSASGASFNKGVFNIYSSSPTMTNVTTSASGGSGSSNYGVYSYSFSSPTMINVTASASGGTYNYGVYNFSSSSPTMINVTASASGGTYTYGVYNYSSSPTMMNMTASASGGTNNYGVHSSSTGTIMINNSVIIGSTNTIYNGINTTTRVGSTKLEGGAVSNSGTLTCAGVYDESYTFYTTACP
jgi:hypothetical protein